eukprot:scaffold21045_cov59-Phaeocystis_antarctica.AAC.4
MPRSVLPQVGPALAALGARSGIRLGVRAPVADGNTPPRWSHPRAPRSNRRPWRMPSPRAEPTAASARRCQTRARHRPCMVASRPLVAFATRHHSRGAPG